MKYQEIGGEFRAFILKGNVVDLAVGVVIGAAFGKVVDSVVKDLITPLIALFGGQHDFSHMRLGPLGVGNFINVTLSFIILAAVVFLLVVKPYHAMKRLAGLEAAAKPAEPPPMPDDVKLLMEIRDLLKQGPPSAGANPVKL